MTKYEYIAKLEKLLAHMPPQERRDALEYYVEYFDAAGPDHEAETAEKLGDPETVAAKILEGAGLSGNADGDSASGAAQPPSDAADGGNPADGPVTRTGLQGPGLLVLFVVILLLVALALALSAAATGFRGFGRDKEIAVTASEQVVSDTPAALADSTPAPAAQDTATPAPAADASAPAAANVSADTQAPSDWETTYPAAITEVDLELSQMNLVVMVDDTVSAVTLRGTGVADSALRVDQQEMDRENKLDARLSADQGSTASLTLVLPANNMPRRLEFKLTGGSATLPDLTLDELEVDSVGAAVTVGRITARKVDLQEEGNGTVSADAIAADEVSLDAKRGTVTVAQVNVSRQLDVEAEGGNVTATLQGRADAFRLEAENKGGTLNVNGESLTGEVRRQGSGSASIEAECQSGTITLGFSG